MSNDLRSRVKMALDEAMAATGKSERALGLEFGRSADLFRKIIAGVTANPRADTIRAIARATGRSEEWLLNGVEGPAQAGSADHPGPGHVDAGPGSAAPAPLHAPPRETMPRNVPVLGTAAGSIVAERIEGFRMFNGDPIDWARRPPALDGVPGAYGIFVVGDSMAPMFAHGDLQFVHPHRPAKQGDVVVVQTRLHDTDPGQAYIKILARRTSERVILRQFNPQAEIEIPMRYVVSIHKVLSMNELFGF